MYSFRIEQAIRAAAVLHKNQVRKGAMPFPYITHLISVAFILHDYTSDEDTIIAALLHDAIEDTGYTLEELQEDFGGTVRDIVEAVTEPKTQKNKTLSWQERKKVYLKQLQNASESALLVAAADKTHNMRSIVETYYDDPGRFLNDFGGTLKDRSNQYQDLANLFNRRLNNDILHEFNHVFAEFKQFLSYVEKKQHEI